MSSQDFNPKLIDAIFTNKIETYNSNILGYQATIQQLLEKIYYTRGVVDTLKEAKSIFEQSEAYYKLVEHNQISKGCGYCCDPDTDTDF